MCRSGMSEGRNPLSGNRQVAPYGERRRAFLQLNRSMHGTDRRGIRAFGPRPRRRFASLGAGTRCRIRGSVGLPPE